MFPQIDTGTRVHLSGQVAPGLEHQHLLASCTKATLHDLLYWLSHTPTALVKRNKHLNDVTTSAQHMPGCYNLDPVTPAATQALPVPEHQPSTSCAAVGKAVNSNHASKQHLTLNSGFSRARIACWQAVSSAPDGVWDCWVAACSTTNNTKRSGPPPGVGNPTAATCWSAGACHGCCLVHNLHFITEWHAFKLIN
jgi:hypothetical protein